MCSAALRTSVPLPTAHRTSGAYGVVSISLCAEGSFEIELAITGLDETGGLK